jgi:capsular polysaccharide biosynthesis protein/Mrp family chromosome partitioning ATPase
VTTVLGVEGGATQQPLARGILEAVIRVLRRRRAVFATVLAGSVLAGALVAVYWTPPYEGRAVLQVQTASAGSLENVEFDLFYTDRLLNTYTELAESDQLHDELVSELGVEGPIGLKAEVPANTELLVVEASAVDPELAAAAANALATTLADDIRENLTQRFDARREALLRQLEELDQRIAELRASAGQEPDAVGDLLVQRDSVARTYNEALSLGASSIAGVSIVQPADAPTARAFSPVLLVGLAGLVGIAGGFALALLVDRLDRTIYDVERAVRDRGYPVLGELIAGAQPPGSDENDVALIPQAIGVAFRLRQASPRSLLLTSAFSGSITPAMVVDLTRALASTGVEVAALDATFEPSLHAVLGTPDRPGLQEALRYGKPLAELAVPTRYPHIHLVPGGKANGATANVIEAFWGLNQLDSLTEAFGLVVVHASPLLERAEASLLGRSVGGTVLVLEDGHMRDTDLDEGLEQVTALPSTFLGVVVARPARRSRRFTLRRRRRSRQR